MFDLTGKTVIITGASGGLGNFVTRVFLRAGASVCGVSRSHADAGSIRFHSIAAQVNSTAVAEHAVDETRERFGRVDALIHLVGGWHGGERLEETSESTFDQMMDINLKSAFFMMAAAARLMREQRSGRLLAIASRAAVEPQLNAGAYSVSKAALVALVRSFAAELAGTGVTANCILPGTMDTPQNRAVMPDADPSKWAQPCEVAELLVHLASNAGSGINGAAIPIYGAER